MDVAESPVCILDIIEYPNSGVIFLSLILCFISSTFFGIILKNIFFKFFHSSEDSSKLQISLISNIAEL